MEARFRTRSICIVVLAMAVLGLTACASTPVATQVQTTSTPASTTSSSVSVAKPTDLPASCTQAPILAPVSPTPTWPIGGAVLNAVPGALATQYPTVFGGVIAAPASPGESALAVSSHLVVLETERDPLLEAEATSAYPPGITVAFELTPHTTACLSAVNKDIAAQSNDPGKAGVTIYGFGLGATQVIVDVPACSVPSEQIAKKWFRQRWGDTVLVKTCQAMLQAS